MIGEVKNSLSSDVERDELPSGDHERAITFGDGEYGVGRDGDD